MLENVKFLRRQVHFPTAHRQLPAFEIQREVLRNKRRQRVTGSVPPQCGTNARQQFFDAKGLDHIIVRSGIERSEEHTSELQSRPHLVCRLLLEKKQRHSTTSLA